VQWAGLREAGWLYGKLTGDAERIEELCMDMLPAYLQGAGRGVSEAPVLLGHPQSVAGRYRGSPDDQAALGWGAPLVPVEGQQRHAPSDEQSRPGG
jgi:hypothetical protein